MTDDLALAIWSSMPSISGSPFSPVAKIASGWALTRSPTSSSEALIGVPTTSRTTRMPLVQMVSSRTLRSLLSLRSQSITAGTRPDSPTAPNRVLRISGRRPMPDSSSPRPRIALVASWSSGEEAAGCRISTISWSPMSLRAHWMMPMPMNRNAPPRQAPRATLEARK